MKILRVINSLEMGGAERSLETNVPIHITHGYDTDILLLSLSNTPFYNNLKDKGVRIYFTSNISIYNPWHILKIIPYLRKYDIVHVHLFPALYWVCFAKLLSFSKTPLVYTEHSTNNGRRGKRLFRIVDRFIYKKYYHIISISDATTESLVKHIGPFHNITTIYNGVDLSPFQKNNQSIELFPGSYNCKIVTQIASFRYPKDQKTTIYALSKLDNNVHAVFVGSGPTMQECKCLAEELGISERIHFLNNRTDIPQIITSSDIIVMSSIYEGFGRAAIEGMAGRKPVIASNVPGLRDIVSGAGLLFPAEDYLKLSEHIFNLFKSEVFYKKIADSCYERAQEYDAQKMITGYETIYDSIKKR